ncbi:hypothetical protein P7K49_026875 [Saguinus oedipus]|uniref:Uncharacterized protein n=1 Tax=Saguinus oedipus TaxID=9490 RepID=A0ABQ9UEF0_SAGOE|nr:hypothetical protein P7K49_026875 [Saguinus oedipus]
MASVRSLGAASSGSRRGRRVRTGGPPAPPAGAAPEPASPQARPLRPVPPRSQRQLLPVMQTLTSRIRFPTEPAEPAGAAHTDQPGRPGTPEAGADKRSQQRASAVAGGGANGHPSGERGEGDPVAPQPAARGNELFRSGQFAEAAHKYSAAIALLEPAGRCAAPCRFLGPWRCGSPDPQGPEGEASPSPE